MNEAAVRRRQVFFFSGFDPKGAAYYHHLFATGAAAQEAFGHGTYEVGRRERTEDRHVQRWQVGWRASRDAVPTEAQAQAETPPQVQTTYEFLTWDDLVRAHWPKTIPGVAWGSLCAYVAALSSGLALVRVWQQSRRTLVALAYPALFWLLALMGGAVLGWGLAQAGLHAGARTTWPPALTSGLAWAAGAAACAGIWSCALWLERRLHTSWLLRIYRFADQWASGKLPDLEQRLDAMAARVVERLRNHTDDEVLLVGYSVGSMLSASVMARVLQQCGTGALGNGGVADLKGTTERLSMLTLGQCVPLLGLMPRAKAYRRELAVLAQLPNLRWTDYSSPGDWGSFALVDPLAICRVVPPGAKGPQARPRMLSPRFHTLFPPQDYAALKRNKRRLHLQYLMAAPLAGAYDYFRLTAGPWRLQAGPESAPIPETQA